MSKRVSALLSLAILPALVLGACASQKVDPSLAYTTPGWYLERPRIVLAVGPEIFGGPFTYDQCESKRQSFDPPVAERLICQHEYTKPTQFGPY